MRLWSLHPKYLDSKGLVALWREALLAQNVLAGNTKGYTNHPQLNRFKKTINPMGAIASYLRFIVIEAGFRGYRFDNSKILNKRLQSKIKVTGGQLAFEYRHLLAKLKIRNTDKYNCLKIAKDIELHPIFTKVGGKIESWEIIP